MEYHRPPVHHATTTATSRARENLKSLLVKCVIASNQPETIATVQETLIENRIEELLPTIHTPDHPPYAWMVENAIVKLNEEGGSSEGAISNFIFEEYKDLPWAHTALLKYHLRRLCEIGRLVECCEGYYMTETQRAVITYKGNPKPLPIFTYAASPSPSPSPSPSLSSSPSLYTSSNSSSTNASSCSSTSSQSFCMKGKKRKRMKESFKAPSHCRRGKGRGCGRGKGRGRGRGKGHSCGRGRGRGNGRGCGRVRRQCGYAPHISGKKKMKQVCVAQSEDEVESAGAQSLMVQVDNLDENIQEFDQLKDQRNQDSVDIENQAEQTHVLIEIDPPEQQCRVNDKRIKPLQQESVVTTRNGSTPCTVAQLHKKIESENRNVRPGKGRGRPHKRVLKLGESATNIESLEATEIGALRGGVKEKNKDKCQLKENQSYHPVTEVCHISDDDTVPNRLAHDVPPVAKRSFSEENIDHASQVEQHEGNMLDQLIDEVYVELMESMEMPHLVDVKCASSSKAPPH